MNHSKPRIYQTREGYDIITSDGSLYNLVGERVKKIGKVNEKYQPSGRLLRKIPNHIKSIFFKLQSL